MIFIGFVLPLHQNQMEMTGVITGDVIASSNIPPQQRKEMLDALGKAACGLQGFSPRDFEIYRGDSFQFTVSYPAQTLRVALLFRAGFKCQTPEGSPALWDVRMAVGIGNVGFEAESAGYSNGEAFVLSGHALDNMTKNRLVVETVWQEVNDEMQATIPLIDNIATNWTMAQAQVAYQMLIQDVTQQQVAGILGKTTQGVNKLVMAAKVKLVGTYLKRFETLINNKLEEHS